MGLQLILIVSVLSYFGLVLCTAQICPGMFRFDFVSFNEPIYCLKKKKKKLRLSKTFSLLKFLEEK